MLYFFKFNKYETVTNNPYRYFVNKNVKLLLNKIKTSFLTEFLKFHFEWKIPALSYIR